MYRFTVSDHKLLPTWYTVWDDLRTASDVRVDGPLASVLLRLMSFEGTHHDVSRNGEEAWSLAKRIKVCGCTRDSSLKSCYL